ncbi:MAG: hypothetical protein ACOY45_15865 [Pseudomonadota bacterium]
MFEGQPTARVDLNAGALYALVGGEGWIYYGQVTPERKLGFFRRRDREPADPAAVLQSPILSVVLVAFPSITRALRAGRWKKLGRFAVVPALVAPRPAVQWPVGTLVVTVFSGDWPGYETRVEDPSIQDMELTAVWDAEHHIPARMIADFGAEEAPWHVGGPIRRERQIAEERARRFADQPGHRLPPDWVATDIVQRPPGGAG